MASNDCVIMNYVMEMIRLSPNLMHTLYRQFFAFTTHCTGCGAHTHCRRKPLKYNVASRYVRFVRFDVSNSIPRQVCRQLGGGQAIRGHGEPLWNERISLTGQSEVPRPPVTAVPHGASTADSVFPKRT
jgi:hypothetical protein